MPRIINTWIANGLRYCWNLLLLIVLVIADDLHFVGQNIDIETALSIITILGFGIPGFVHLGKILCFVVQKVDMRTRVVILTILGLDIPGFIEICQDGLPATPGPWSDFRTLMYAMAAVIVIFSQNHLMRGVACTFAAMETLIAICRHLPQEYVFTAVSTLVVLAIIAKLARLARLYGYIPYRAYQRWMRV